MLSWRNDRSRQMILPILYETKENGIQLQFWNSIKNFGVLGFYEGSENMGKVRGGATSISQKVEFFKCSGQLVHC